MTVLEVCVGNHASLEAAFAARPHRIELCAALEAGGVTPTPAAIRAAIAGRPPGMAVNVLVRPRGGDFLYSAAEGRQMLDDIDMAGACGADAVVAGALTPQADIDLPLLEAMHRHARRHSMRLTFHRAFDMARRPLEALEAVIPYADTILTSGQAAAAAEGTALLRALAEAAQGRISIMAGGGINAANAAAIARATGADAIHGTFARPCPSAMQWRREGVNMGTPGADEYSLRVTDSREVATALHNLSLLQ